MKYLSTLLLVAIFAVGTVGATAAGTVETDKEKAAIASLEASAAEAAASLQWNLFSERLVDALASDHQGIKQAAMRLVIRYGENVNVKGAVFDVMRVYRNGNSETLRRMAVVTLAKMQSEWAIKFLERSERFERCESVRKTIHDVITNRAVS